ncbi:AlpA family transcriptional regulator [Microlunatus sp. Gsoil 973]|uniref:helix-turn-helix transcriptional regulator n=1 Tax=Microlunatus sp. Gsoil 973 TaxID=2672569 RepID=UPI001E2C4B6C|nr:helix-turn-helix domain-containing protein [Microlunatus sp. Gsoil 973]
MERIEAADDELLPMMMTSAEVARALKVAPSTLCRWRARGIGPRVFWLGDASPRYRRTDVLAWLERVAS